MKLIGLLRKYPSSLLIILAFILYFLLSLARHNYFKTAAFDLGIYDQTVWLYSHFQPPFSSLKELLQPADHFGPILILFAPFYWLYPNPATLLILQAFLVALSALPAYLLAKKRFGEFFGFCILLSYLSFIGIQEAIKFDFHLATISVFFISWTYYFAILKNWKYYWLFLSLALICKEDVSILLIGLGIYLFIFINKKIGFLTVLISGIFFIVVQFVIMKALGNNGGYLDYDSLGEKPVEMISFVLFHPFQTLWFLVDNPIKTHTQEAMFSSFSYLPFFSVFGWLTILPHLAERFLSSYSGRWQLFWHYTVNSTPSLVFGTILATDFLVKSGQKIGLNKKRLVFSFGVLLLLSIYGRVNLYQPPLLELTKKEFWQKPIGVDDSVKIIESIPSQASVLAQSSLVPHLSYRKNIYMLGLQKKPTEYVVLNLDLNHYPYLGKGLEEDLQSYLNDPDYKLVSQIGNGYLFQKRSP